MASAGKLDKVAKLVEECRAGKDRSCQSLAEVAKHDKDEAVRKAAIEAIPDQAVLAEIAKNDRSYGNFTAAIGRLTDQSLLAEIARTGNEYVRQLAVGKLTDQAVLAEIAKKDGGELVRQSAVFRLTDPTLLAGIARTDPSPPMIPGAEMTSRRVPTRKPRNTMSDETLTDISSDSGMLFMAIPIPPRSRSTTSPAMNAREP